MKSSTMKGISMEVGDYGWIMCKGLNEKYTGWFLRLKVNGKVAYVSKVDSSFMIPDTFITNNDNDDYVLWYKVGAIEVMNGYELPKIKSNEIANLGKSLPLKEKIKTLENEIYNIKQTLVEKSEELTDLKLQLHDILNNITKENNEVNSCKMYQYIYGTHVIGYSSNPKEYCWINVKGLNIEIGDTIEVESGNNIEYATVTRIENSTEIKNHKPVLNKISKQ